jgi:hypothetical protein
VATATAAPTGGGNSVATGNAWSSPGNITADDAFVAQCTIPAGDESDYLLAQSFGFAIPSGATVDGIEVLVKRYGMGTCEDFLVRLLDDTGAQVGDNQAVIGVAWPGMMGNAGYGGPLDDWSAGLTWDQVNDEQFGVAIQATSAAGATVIVGYVEITIYYSGGAADDFPRVIQSQTSRRPLVAPTRPSFVILDLGTEVIEAVSAWEPIVVSAGPRREGPPQRSRVILTDEKLAGAGTLPDTTPGQLPEVVVAAMRPRERSRVSTWLSIVIDAGSGEMCLCPFGATVVASRFATASIVSTLFAPAVGQRASYTADVVSDRFATAVLVSHVCSC